MKTVDNIIAVRIIYLLTLPFDKWPAFGEGIIDAEGTFLQPGADSENWTMLHRLVARLKIMLGKIPGGKTSIASWAAAYLLVRECVEQDSEPDDLASLFENVDVDFKSYLFVIRNLQEDGEPANNINNVAGIKPGDEPPGVPPAKKKKKVKNGVPSIPKSA